MEGFTALHHHHQEADHVKFDEFTIAEHDKDRGTRQRIDEPKTPYDDSLPEEEQADIEMKAEEKQQLDEEIKMHLEEAERNKLLNAQLQQAQDASVMQQFHKDLQEKLDQTQSAQDDVEKSKYEGGDERV